MENEWQNRSVFHVRVDGAGRVVIPAGLRARHHIEVGHELVIEDDGTGLRLRTMDDVICEIQAYCAKFGNSERLWSDELIAERRAEAERE